MDNFIFSVNATLPIFILMCLGYLFRKTGLVDLSFASAMNRFVFKIALPAMLFSDLAAQDFASTWDGKYVLFCFAVTLVSIGIAALVAHFVVKERAERGEFVQVSYRSSAAILGLAFIGSIYGESNTAMAPLMILGSVPLYNIFAVVVLTLSAEKGKTNKEPASGALLKKTLLGILKNPIILGIAAGLAWSLLRFPVWRVPDTVLTDLGRLATPLGLIAMGASFDPHAAKGQIGPAVLSAFIKLIGFAALFLPAAVALGFRDQQLVAIMVMLGSASTVSCYVMATSMGHEGTLTANTVMLTTAGCSFTLTFWLYILRSMGFI